MVSQVKFGPVGIDLKELHGESVKSIDNHIWDQNIEAYQFATNEMGISENFLQLISIEDEREFSKLISYWRRQRNFTIVCVNLIITTIDAYSPKHPVQQIPMDEGWLFLGYDVCDIDGFFSYFGMVPGAEHHLFADDELYLAFALAECANILVPEHRPFVVVRLLEWQGEFDLGPLG